MTDQTSATSKENPEGVTSNESPISFHGRVVAQATGPVDHPDLLGRHHVITVYETEQGELNLVLEFKTFCDAEKSHFDVEPKVNLDEISELMLMYDPSQYLNRKRLCHRHESVIKQFLKRLHKQYDDLCASIEHQLLNYEPSVPVRTDSSDATSRRSPRWKSWIRFAKPR